ncbi:MAG: hypothetical protein ACYDAQ_06005 [Mycobacteriales bacterium]
MITRGFPAGSPMLARTSDHTVSTVSTVNTVSPGSVTATEAVAANSSVSVVAGNSTNSGAPGSYQVSVGTSADTQPAASSPDALTAAPTVSAANPMSGPPAGGSGGATLSYAVEGAGGAVGANVQDTRISCFVWQGGGLCVFGSNYIPGVAAAVVGTFASGFLGTSTICWSVRAFLFNGTIQGSGMQCPGLL